MVSSTGREGRGPDDPTEDGWTSPLRHKIVDRQFHVEAPPPVHAEGAGVRQPDIPLGAGPVPANGA